MRVSFFAIVAIALLGSAAAAPRPPASLDAQMPRYEHIFVIVEENKNYDQVMGQSAAPTLSSLAQEYGNATRFYSETHPSQPNYVAMVGGYTYGIRDDDAWFCTPHMRNPSCPNSNKPGYVDHTIDAPNLATQLEGAHLTWKDYLESLPAPGSLVAATRLYASKHSGFVNFVSVQRDLNRAEHLVGFDQLYADLNAGTLPNFAMIVPNICDEMHGEGEGPETPQGCGFQPIGALIRRGDENVDTIVSRIMASPMWRSSQNAAIVITFDENDAYTFDGCCGNDPNDPANRGGGHIPTIVVTNHGPRHVADATPYNHYALLRTIEDAFGIHEYLQRAAAPGVVPMLPLFRTRADR